MCVISKHHPKNEWITLFARLDAFVNTEQKFPQRHLTTFVLYSEADIQAGQNLGSLVIISRVVSLAAERYGHILLSLERNMFLI